MSGPTEFSPTQPRDTGAKLDSILLALLVLTMCSQINLSTIGRDTMATEGFATKRLFIALSDVVLLLAFGWFVVRTTVLGAWRRIWWPPFASWALIFAMIIAALHSPHVTTAVTGALAEAEGPKQMVKAFLVKESKEAIAEIVQWTAYFIFAPLLFVNLMRDGRTAVTIHRKRLAIHAFSGAVLLNVLIAVVQRFTGSDAPYGLFLPAASGEPGSPNIYNAFVAFSLPLLLAHALWSWRDTKPALITSLLCLGGALLTFVSHWAAIVLIIALILAGWLQNQRARTTQLLILCLPMLFLWGAPSKLQPARVASSSISSETEKVKKQYVEWGATPGWATPRQRQFATGVGPGNYQFNIGSYYNKLPNEEKMPPDSNNLYLVQAVSIGLLGLGTLLWVLSHFAGLAWTAHRRDMAAVNNAADAASSDGVSSNTSFQAANWLGAGTLASLAAFVAVNFFHAAIVRGTGIVLAFILSLAVIALHAAYDKES